MTSIYFNPSIRILDRIKRAVRPGGLPFDPERIGSYNPPRARAGTVIHCSVQTLDGATIVVVSDPMEIRKVEILCND